MQAQARGDLWNFILLSPWQSRRSTPHWCYSLQLGPAPPLAIQSPASSCFLLSVGQLPCLLARPPPQWGSWMMSLQLCRFLRPSACSLCVLNPPPEAPPVETAAALAVSPALRVVVMEP